MGLFDFFSKETKENKETKESLDKGLEKTKDSFFSKLGKAVMGKSKVDDEVLDDLEEILITSDVGVETTLKIIKRIEQRVSVEKYTTASELDRLLKEEITKLLAENNAQDVKSFFTNSSAKPYVIMVVGVNGVGKTTTIGKLASKFQRAGNKVVLGAADTFRAAAVDQLKLWAQRVNVPIVSHGMNTDPASVAYDAVKQGVDSDADIVIIDTAGRLHTKVNLMNELSKIKRVMQKVIPDAPHEILLVLDGSTGQNAFIQAKEFTRATEVNALAITKLDGTAKGGIAFAMVQQIQRPIRYIGTGEKMDDLALFDARAFVDALFEEEVPA